MNRRFFLIDSQYGIIIGKVGGRCRKEGKGVVAVEGVMINTVGGRREGKGGIVVEGVR